MRIDTLRLFGAGPFGDTTLEFPRGRHAELADTYLIVGQNGTGKTTALQLLAHTLSPVFNIETSDTERRLSRIGSRATATYGDICWHSERVPHADQKATSLGPNGTHLVSFSSPSELAGLVARYQPNESKSSEAWDRWQSSYAAPKPTNLSWAIFCYAGQRSLGRVRVTAIQEPQGTPLSQSLMFQSSTDAQRLGQWIANQDFKRLKAIHAGRMELATAIASTTSAIETTISTVIERRFQFQLAVEDLNVRVLLDNDIVEFDLLPEGLKSIVSWVADLLMRLDLLGWSNDLPIHQREFLLLLDEVDVHLHPAWQRKLLPVIQRLFPKAQIIASTHSPFVVASLKDGAVIELKLDEKGRSRAEPPVSAPLEMSYSQTLRRLFGIESDFDIETEKLFKELQATATRVLKDESGAREELDQRAAELKSRGEEIAQLVQFELNQLNRLKPRPTGT